MSWHPGAWPPLCELPAAAPYAGGPAGSSTAGGSTAGSATVCGGAAGTLPCTACSVEKAKDAYSKKQWKKGYSRRCRECLEAAE